MSNQRKSTRQRVLKGAVAVGDDPNHEIPCTIHDMSYTGCKIRVGKSILPDKFELKIDFDGISVASEVVWRRHPDIGVRFVGPLKSTTMKRVQIPMPTE